MAQSKIKNSNFLNPSHKRIPHWMIAEAAGCAISTVKAVRNGQRNNETRLGQRIMVAEILIEDKLINEVKQVLQFK